MIARARSAEVVRNLMSRYATLHAAAAASPGSRAVAGRGTAYTIATADGDWLVRHYRRGGAVAHVLGDRYLRVGTPRAVRELQLSEAVRARGIPTPEVVAAVAYRSGWFTRGDIAVTLLANANDLAVILFGKGEGEGEGEGDVQADVARAAALIRTICERGLLHADLNLKNIVISNQRGYIVDLDRCRVGEPSEAAAQAMRRRFLRSLEKWESRTGRRIASELRRTLEEAFRVG